MFTIINAHSYFVYVFVVVGMGPGILWVLDKYSVVEPHCDKYSVTERHCGFWDCISACYQGWAQVLKQSFHLRPSSCWRSQVYHCAPLWTFIEDCCCKMSVLPVCLYVYHLHKVLPEARKGSRSLKLELWMVLSHHMMLGMKPVSGRQPVLLTAQRIKTVTHLPVFVSLGFWPGLLCVLLADVELTL